MRAKLSSSYALQWQGRICYWILLATSFRCFGRPSFSITAICEALFITNDLPRIALNKFYEFMQSMLLGKESLKAEGEGLSSIQFFTTFWTSWPAQVGIALELYEAQRKHFWWGVWQEKRTLCTVDSCETYPIYLAFCCLEVLQGVLVLDMDGEEKSR